MLRAFPAFALGFAAAFGCFGQSAVIGVSSGTSSPGNTVALNISLTAAGSAAPAAAQWTINYSTNDFSNITVAQGPTATAANKGLSCNTTPGAITCQVWGLNQTAIANGVIATASLTLSALTTNTSSQVQLAGVVVSDGWGRLMPAAVSAGTVSIQPGISGFSCSPLAVNPMASSTCTVSLSSSAPNGGATITLGAAPAVANTPASVVVAQGTISANFAVTARSVTTATPVTLTASYLGVNSTFNLTVNPPAPVNVSVAPGSGSGLSQTFSFTYSDSSGVADISWVQMHFQTQLVAAGACYLQYTRATNSIVLINDAGAAALGPVTLGSSGTLHNSQCTLNAATSSVSASGNNLVVNLALTFAGSFLGTKNISMGAINNANVFSGWQTLGSWTVQAPSQPAANVSVNPASGAGVTQVFSFTYADPAGTSDISWTQMHFQTQLVANGACYLQYTRATNSIVLMNDAGTTALGPVTLGSSGALNNSQCALSAAGSSVSVSGNNLTVNLSLTFQPAFAGSKNISMGVINNANVFSGWQQMGTWTASAGNLPPQNISVSPASGAGSSGTFNFTYADPYGSSDLSWLQLDFQTQLSGAGGCYIQYTIASNTAQLINDAGTGNVGSGGTLGSSATLANSQCSLSLGSSSAAAAGNNFTLTLALSFTPAFLGSKNVYMGAISKGNLFSGWRQMGAWSVTMPGNQPPANVSVSPSSGSGVIQTFSFGYSDPYGYGDISWVQMHFQTQLVANNACYLQYTQATNTLQLINDAGTGPVGSGGTLGSSGTLANSQCSVNLASSSASGSGNNLVVNVAITFNPSFSSAQDVSMGAINNAGVFSGWLQMGVWTP